MRITKEWQAIKAAMEAGKGIIGQENEKWWKETRIFPAIIRVHPFGTREACEFFGVSINQFQEWNWKQHCHGKEV